jgi:hypothetical protein
MMNTVLGSAIGGVVAGAVALGAAAVVRPSPAPLFAPDAASAYAMPVANTAAFNNGAVLQCQPHEEAVLQRALVAGREVSAMTCITRANSAPAYFGQPYAQPVYQPEPMATRPVVRTRQAAPARQRVVYQDDVRREPERSWGKTAMIIGGSTGAGAGLGGIIGGKKGALIGAAIGGGAATIYESTKR